MYIYIQIHFLMYVCLAWSSNKNILRGVHWCTNMCAYAYLHTLCVYVSLYINIHCTEADAGGRRSSFHLLTRGFMHAYSYTYLHEKTPVH